MRSRRVALATGGINATLVPEIESWLDTLDDSGKWPDSEVDYTTGCDGRRANWPAEEHWVRIQTLAAAWRGGVPGADVYVNSTTILAVASRAMDFWFTDDMPNLDCLYAGGSGNCPCGTPGFWNTNWFPNVIGVPVLIGDTCLILGNDTLSDTQYGNCSNILRRTFGTFASGQGFLAGANILDIAKCGITAGLLTENSSWLEDAYGHVHDEVVVHDARGSDGIRPDGSFGQHTGIIYNGNYGKDYSNDVIALEIIAAGTEFAASGGSRSAFETLMDGSLWMIYKNVRTGTLHWDFSVTGRMITFAVADEQATSSILINTTLLGELGQLWDSDIISSAAIQLTSDTDDANVGFVKGNRMFYNNDYMVHRGDAYVSTLRMFSSRTANTECTNNQNVGSSVIPSQDLLTHEQPFGFHLADGVVYTYLEGDEYEDIASMWDWNLIPGITTDYNNTPLDCEKTRASGKEAFVGGASDGTIGAAAMRYTNPLTGALSFQKAWFFLDDDVQHVMVSSLTSTSSAPVISVLDQKRHSGPVLLNGLPLPSGGNFSDSLTLWHDGVGYAFPSGTDVSVYWGTRTGDWGAIGASASGVQSADLFSAWIVHGAATTPSTAHYSAFPATAESGGFLAKAAKTAATLVTVRNDGSVSAVYDSAHRVAAAVFWDARAGGNATFAPPGPLAACGAVTVSASTSAIVIYRLDEGEITVADPTQALSNVDVTLEVDGVGTAPVGFDGRTRVTVSVPLPSGGAAGKSVTVSLSSS
ncbi:polysaccharide lyase family 8 protein [Epithele typhae]|uniref:polysaccharide lyase family 8 protein n=1 Tax=Epithele typhae TaxID=378194 RepID=UPI002007FAB5|nr:polysaccharide lyase family 8 protein [Epithele typhae]KAH9935095.1 polysaccharide lyase family 8 protein [Epithele typhae]